MSIYYILALSFLNATCVSAARVVLPLYALSQGVGPAMIGVLAAMFSAFPMLLAVTAGKIADRFGSRWMLLCGAVGGVLGMTIPYFVHGLPAIFVAGAMSGLSLVLFNVSTQNLVGLMSTQQDRARNFSNYSLAVSGADLVAPLIAGFSIDHWGYITACLELAALSVVPAIMLVIWGALLPGGTLVAKGRGLSVLSMLKAPEVVRLLATGSLANVGLNLFMFYMPVYAHSTGLSASVIGAVLALNSVAAFVVRIVLAPLLARFGAEKMLAYAFYVGATSMTLIPFFQTAAPLGVISFVFGLGMGLAQPIVTMLMFTTSKDGRSGEALGLKITVNHFTKVVSPMLFGVIAAVFGLSPMFWINALMLSGGGILSRSRKPRREGTSEAQ